MVSLPAIVPVVVAQACAYAALMVTMKFVFAHLQFPYPLFLSTVSSALGAIVVVLRVLFCGSQISEPSPSSSFIQRGSPLEAGAGGGGAASCSSDEEGASPSASSGDEDEGFEVAEVYGRPSVNVRSDARASSSGRSNKSCTTSTWRELAAAATQQHEADSRLARTERNRRLGDHHDVGVDDDKDELKQRVAAALLLDAASTSSSTVCVSTTASEEEPLALQQKLKYGAPRDEEPSYHHHTAEAGGNKNKSATEDASGAVAARILERRLTFTAGFFAALNFGFKYSALRLLDTISFGILMKNVLVSDVVVFYVLDFWLHGLVVSPGGIGEVGTSDVRTYLFPWHAVKNPWRTLCQLWLIVVGAVCAAGYVILADGEQVVRGGSGNTAQKMWEQVNTRPTPPGGGASFDFPDSTTSVSDQRHHLDRTLPPSTAHLQAVGVVFCVLALLSASLRDAIQSYVLHPEKCLPGCVRHWFLLCSSASRGRGGRAQERRRSASSEEVQPVPDDPEGAGRGPPRVSVFDFAAQATCAQFLWLLAGTLLCEGVTPFKIAGDAIARDAVWLLPRHHLRGSGVSAAAAAAGAPETAFGGFGISGPFSARQPRLAAASSSSSFTTATETLIPNEIYLEHLEGLPLSSKSPAIGAEQLVVRNDGHILQHDALPAVLLACCFLGLAVNVGSAEIYKRSDAVSAACFRYVNFLFLALFAAALFHADFSKWQLLFSAIMLTGVIWFASDMQREKVLEEDAERQPLDCRTSSSSAFATGGAEGDELIARAESSTSRPAAGPRAGGAEASAVARTRSETTATFTTSNVATSTTASVTSASSWRLVCGVGFVAAMSLLGLWRLQRALEDGSETGITILGR